MPGAHSIERFLVEEAIRRVINAHSKDRKEWYVGFKMMKYSRQTVNVRFELCGQTLIHTTSI